LSARRLFKQGRGELTFSSVVCEEGEVCGIGFAFFLVKYFNLFDFKLSDTGVESVGGFVFEY